MGYIAKKQLKSGVKYYPVFKDPSGRKRWARGFKRKKDAEAMLLRIDYQIAQGNYNKPKDVTFTAFAKKWLTEYASLRKPRTLEGYKQDVKNHLEPFFGDYLLRDITTKLVDEYVALKVGQGLSARTVNKTITLLRMMLKKAVAWGIIEENRALYSERVRDRRREMDYLEPNEVYRLLENVPSEEHRVLFATAIFTGAREGEALALKWGDLNEERKVLYIRRSYNRYSELYICSQ